MANTKKTYLRKYNFNDSREKVSLLVEIAKAYYEQNHDQASIAQSLGISTSQVSRYLTQARDLDLIQVRVVAPEDHMSALEERLGAAFPGLQEVIVAPAFQMSDAALRRTIGRAAARYLEQKIRPGARVCVGSGRSLCEVFTWLKPQNIPNISIVQAMCNVGHEAMEIDFNEMARSAAEAFQGQVSYMNAPAILGSGKATDFVATNPSIKQALNMARTADVYLFGVGSLESDLIFTRWNLIKPEELEQLRKAGAVGDICSRFYNIDGKIMPSAMDPRIVGIDLQDLAGKALTIAVAGGKDKVLPLVGALRGGFIKTLITDEQTSMSILDLVHR
jgi:DNA-binding transcriptional regulator LsrR (DeoR family)